ncbi:MAG: NADH:flavin oxidoreductase, partial [Methanococcoides sp.]|nr:NADH:flavin oxidoreductase [Methanococcoides sp.]
KRGYDVTLFEKTDHIGGQLHFAGKMKIKHDIRCYLENLQFQLNLLIEDGLKVEFNKVVTPDDINNKFDVILCCTGLKTSIPDIEGLESVRYAEVREFLKNDMDIPNGVKDVLVIGGGIMGCEVGYSLAYEKDLNVVVVGKNKDLLPKTVMANRSQMLWMMMGEGSPSGKKDDALKKPIKAYNASEVIRFSGNKAYLAVNKGRNAPYTPWKALIPENVNNPFEKDLDPGNVKELELTADLVLFATSGKPNNSLFNQLLKENSAKEIYSIGDSSEPGNLWKAITNANEIARNI